MADQAGRRGAVQAFNGLNVLAGLWLVLAPWLLGYSLVPTALWNDLLVGLAVMILAGLRIMRPDRYISASWVTVAFGLWLVIAHFVLQYGEGFVMRNVAFWNDVVAGSVVVALAWLSAESTRRMALH